MLTQKNAWLLCFLIGSLLGAGVASAEVRSEKHQKYATTLWEHLQNPSYTSWAVAGDDFGLHVGPPAGSDTKRYVNKPAASDPGLPHGSVIVTEHFSGEYSPVGVTVCYRARDGFHEDTDDWYWAHFLPDGTVVKTVADHCPYGKRGFYTAVEDGRLWVFRLGTKELADFVRRGEPAKQVIRPAAGPNGMTIKSADTATINEYLTAKSGYVTKDVDGRVWIFREGSQELAEFESTGEPAKHVIRPGAGPQGMTVKAPDSETLDAYLRALAP